MPRRYVPSLLLLILVAPAFAQEAGDQPKRDTSRGDRMLAEYFAAETAKLEEDCLAEIQTLDDWNAKKGEYRRQLLEMLGLDPLPQKTDLKAEVTGKTEHDEIVVENIHFQSRPGLYVTGNLYLPKKINPEKPLPTILYVCGHGQVKKDGIAYGAKANYQHHGAWFARNGYACLTIDTLQLGEIEGIHHGTHRYGMWWWLNRGYTPAGVEAWNCVRALDYLETRPEVDKTRFGVTGRSGGGAYSWWIAAIDDRIQCAVPVAGITTLRNHVVDGTVEGHCDCMFMVNTYRWDYPLVAALVAPRPLLIANSDTDRIFPLDGVYHTFEKVRSIYRLHEPVERGVTAKVALNITAGPHKDTQELQTHAFRWFNFHLKGDDSPIDSRAPKLFEPEQLKVFKELPKDQINTEIHETFVAEAGPPPAVKEPLFLRSFAKVRERVFRGWPVDESPRLLSVDDPFASGLEDTNEVDGIRLEILQFQSQPNVVLDLYVLRSAKLKKAELIVLHVLNEETWGEFLSSAGWAFKRQLAPAIVPDQNAWRSISTRLEEQPQIMVYMCPRGIGPTAFDQTERKQVQIQRRFYLLGQTLEAMQVYDVRAAMDVLRGIEGLHGIPPLWMQSQGTMAAITLYAALLNPPYPPNRLDLYDLSRNHDHGPFLLNVDRFIQFPEVVAHLVGNKEIVIYQEDESGWEYPQAVSKSISKALGRPDRFEIRQKPKQSGD